MKVTFTILILLFSLHNLFAQPNCSILEGACKQACEIFVESSQHNQGTYVAHQSYDSAIALCPTFAYAHHEKSVGYLKNGEFLLWRKYMDEAVRLDPMLYLENRGWCRFKFLHDYEGALEDLQEAKRIQHGHLGWSGDGDYDLNLMIALCYRELGHIDSALSQMNTYFIKKQNDKKGLGVGLYDYLHYGVTLMNAGKDDLAMSAFEKQVKENPQLPDTYYYLSLLHEKLGNAEKSVSHLDRAMDYFVKGYSRKDPYCRALDAVYLSDIKSSAQKKH